MHTQTTSLFRHILAISAFGACLASPLAIAANTGAGAATPTNADIQAQYKRDMERCKAGQTNQDLRTCEREAGAALEEARRHRLGNGNDSFQKNQTARCQELTGTERDDCMIQMSGQNTTTQGSVGAGGVLRETTIVVPGVAQPAQEVMPPAPVPGETPVPATPVPGQTPVPSTQVPGATPLAPTPVPGVAPAVRGQGLAPNAPAVVPAPSLAPSPNTVPGTAGAPSPMTPIAPVAPGATVPATGSNTTGSTR